MRAKKLLSHSQEQHMTASKRMLIRLKVKSMMEGRWLLINEIAVCPRTMDETGSMRG